jgi:ketosteroid isomerase-like protein
MPAQRPEQCDLLISEAINAGNIDAALALYESNATFAPELDQSVTGLPAIRKVMEGFTALNPKLTVEVPLVLESGDIALLHSKWTITGTNPDGSSMNAEGKGVEVVRRQADGTWKFIIDNPNGSP